MYPELLVSLQLLCIIVIHLVTLALEKLSSKEKELQRGTVVVISVSIPKEWSMPLRNWNVAVTQSMIEYQGRLPGGCWTLSHQPVTQIYLQARANK